MNAPGKCEVSWGASHGYELMKHYFASVTWATSSAIEIVDLLSTNVLERENQLEDIY